MDLKIDKKNIENFDLGSLKGKSDKALDRLWNAAWLRNSINELDRNNLENIQMIADKICRLCDTVVIAAAGDLGKMIKAVTSAISKAGGRGDVIVFGDTLSPEEYAEVMTELENRDFVLIAATEGAETLAERGAFVCLKQLMVSKYGRDKAIDRIYAIASKESQLIAKDAAENDYPLISYPDEVPAAYGANTVAALLPMAIKGVDVSSYLEGFRDMLASPAWDRDATDYSVARALFKGAGGEKENFLIWQKELEDFGKWEEIFYDGMEKRMLRMPRDLKADHGNSFDTQILIEEDQADIMMPYFEGCNEDGSLNLLLNDTANKYFFENSKEKTGVQISVKRLDSYTLGQLTAFVQLSNGITEFLLNN